MAFQINLLHKIQDQETDGVDKYSYGPTSDTIATITTANYFPAGQFRGDLQGFTMIEVYASDGPYEVQLVGGVASVVSGSPVELSANSVGARPQAGFDNADAIELAASRIKEGKITFAAGEYEIHRTVYIPAGVYIVGKSGSRGFESTSNATVFKSVSGGSYVENYLFFMNIDPDGDTTTWVKQYPNNDSGGASHVFIDGTETSGINGFKFAGSHIFRNIHNKKVGTLISKPGGVYTDKVEISQIHSANRANGTDYLVSLPGLGDGYIIETVASGYINGEGDGFTNGVYVGACRSGQLCNPINGRHMIEGAESFEIYGMHIEGGNITLKDCNAHVRDGVMFREDNADGQIILDSDNGVFNNRYEVSISNVTFDQSMNRRGGLQQSHTPDIVTNQFFTVNINDCRRKITDSSNVSLKQYYGVQVGDSTTTMLDDFNNYSHILSKRCVIANNVVFVDGNIPPQNLAFGGLTSSLVGITDAEFESATSTYYYQAKILQDPVRLIGRNPSLGETSVSATNGGDIVELLINWSLIVNKTMFTLRIYRGTSSGVYDQYVDIPIISAQKFYDVGPSISGFSWRSRAATGVDSINTGADGAISLTQGVFFGRTVGAKPTLGTWKTGDELQKTNPTLSGSGTNTNNRFLRLTNGSAHVSNTDWVVLANVQG